MKTCPKCNTNKELSDFYKKKSSKDGYASWCKECTKAKPYSPEVNRRCKLKRAYGISHEEYNELLKFQGGVCAICKEFRPHLGDHMCVDHDHKTGKVRGILCSDCNRALGLFKDNKENLLQAIGYLEV